MVTLKNPFLYRLMEGWKKVQIQSSYEYRFSSKLQESASRWSSKHARSTFNNITRLQLVSETYFEGLYKLPATPFQTKGQI